MTIVRQSSSERRSIVKPIFSLESILLLLLISPVFKLLSRDLLSGLESIDFPPELQDLLIIGREGDRLRRCQIVGY